MNARKRPPTRAMGTVCVCGSRVGADGWGFGVGVGGGGGVA